MLKFNYDDRRITGLAWFQGGVGYNVLLNFFNKSNFLRLLNFTLKIIGL